MSDGLHCLQFPLPFASLKIHFVACETAQKSNAASQNQSANNERGDLTDKEFVLRFEQVVLALGQARRVQHEDQLRLAFCVEQLLVVSQSATEYHRGCVRHESIGAFKDRKGSVEAFSEGRKRSKVSSAIEQTATL